MKKASHSSTSSDIDFVLLWVDGGDPAWRAKKAKYLPNGDPDDTSTGEQRYRDWGLLRYWFRGVEAFAPWVRKVFFVTDDQWPAWLNKNAPKLVCTSHRDFIPENCLPTFNSAAIEMNLRRLNGLSERFVEFNDDTYIGRSVTPDLFFHNGFPVQTPHLKPVVAQYPNRPLDYFLLNEAAVINHHFNGRNAVTGHLSKWIQPWRIGIRRAFWNWLFSFLDPCPGFDDPHLPFSLLKDTLDEISAAEPELVRAVSERKFRTNEDIGPRVFRDWQFATGKFWPRRQKDIGAYYRIEAKGIDSLCKAIVGKRHNLICANDVGPLSSEEFSTFRDRLENAFRTILPEKSSFER